MYRSTATVWDSFIYYFQFIKHHFRKWFPHRQKHRCQQQDDRIHKSFIIYGDLWGKKNKCHNFMTVEQKWKAKCVNFEKPSETSTDISASHTEGREIVLKVKCKHTDDPCSTTRVRKAHGKPKPSRMSKILLPMELDTAMSPIPEKGNDGKCWTEALTPQRDNGTCSERFRTFGSLYFFYLVELQSDWPCSPAHWSLLPGTLYPWCSLGCLVCNWW